MRTKVKPDFDKLKLGINPHISTLVIPIVSQTLSNQYKIDSEGNKLPVDIEMEYTSYTKLYRSKSRKVLVNRLTASAKSLFLWLMYEIKAGEDYIWINKDRYLEETLTSYNTYKKGLLELHRYAFITPTKVKGVYWINPDFFFNGSRVKKYPKHCKLQYENY